MKKDYTNSSAKSCGERLCSLFPISSTTPIRTTRDNGFTRSLPRNVKISCSEDSRPTALWCSSHRSTGKRSKSTPPFLLHKAGRRTALYSRGTMFSGRTAIHVVCSLIREHTFGRANASSLPVACHCSPPRSTNGRSTPTMTTTRGESSNGWKHNRFSFEDIGGNLTFRPTLFCRTQRQNSPLTLIFSGCGSVTASRNKAQSFRGMKTSPTIARLLWGISRWRAKDIGAFAWKGYSKPHVSSDCAAKNISR